MASEIEEIIFLFCLILINLNLNSNMESVVIILERVN